MKLVAVIIMLIDHIAAALIGRVLIYNGFPAKLYNFYFILRMIGRPSFPIYCFLLVEGFCRTRSKAKYALRLGVFALVSEIPFDLAFKARVLEFGHQNVFFTLLLGLLALCCYDYIAGKRLPAAVKWLLCVVVLAVFCGVAEFLKTDYAGEGVLAISAMYLFRKSNLKAMTAGCMMLALPNESEIPAFFALIPVALYNGERGLKLKYFFYIFYPAHLLVLWLIAVFMGLGGIPGF